MNEESIKDKRIRLKVYKAIEAGEKAAQEVIEKNWGNIPIDEYWRVFNEEYEEYIRNNPINSK